MSNCVEHFTGRIVEHLRRCISNGQSSSILIYAATQNNIPVMVAITKFVAEIENWGPTDYTTFNSFNLAKQRLYMMHNLLLDLHQKPMSHPEWSHTQIEVGGYSTLFYDHELNADDPYFNEIKRDYYNDVSN